MGRRVAGRLALVPGEGDHSIIDDHHRPNRDLAGSARPPGLVQSQSHQLVVVHGRHRSAIYTGVEVDALDSLAALSPAGGPEPDLRRRGTRIRRAETDISRRISGGGSHPP